MSYHPISFFTSPNAIIYPKNNQTIGVGSGQMSRINSEPFAIYLFYSNCQAHQHPY
ncbi:MAG: hypothetical protein NZ730_13720 [Porticoccaceae bacterium]|nr:hypothetical protein [Porticoccaceae bacterium]